MIVGYSAPCLQAKTFNRSAIMLRAWELARAWHAEARSFHFAQQPERPRVALRLEAPAPFVGKLPAHSTSPNSQSARASRCALKPLRRSSGSCAPISLRRFFGHGRKPARSRPCLKPRKSSPLAAR